jgi:hypothetical protein
LAWLWLLALIPISFLVVPLLGLLAPPKFLGLALLMKELRRRDVNPHSLGRETLEAHVDSAIQFSRALALIREKPFRVALHDRIVQHAYNIAEVVKGLRKPDPTIDAILLRHAAGLGGVPRLSDSPAEN